LLGSIAPPSAVTAIANAASWQTGPVTPGENHRDRWSDSGSSADRFRHDPGDGKYRHHAGRSNGHFNNVPAPIIYTSGSETSVQVPNNIIPSPFTPTANVVVQTPGQTTQVFSVPLALASPGLFAANSSGAGPLAAMNQDAA